MCEIEYSIDLSKIAEDVPLWKSLAREQGLGALFVDEDWVSESLTDAEIFEHKIYEHEYNKEVLLREDSSVIIYSDSLSLNSSILRSLKEDRIKKFGTMQNLFSNSATRHLIELSPGTKLISKANERATLVDVENCKFRFDELQRRQAKFFDMYCQQIGAIEDRLASSVEIDAIKNIFFDQIASGFSKGDFFVKNVEYQGEYLNVIAFNLSDELVFMLVPYVALSSFHQYSKALIGSLSIWFRLIHSCQMNEFFSFERERNVNIAELMPLRSFEYFNDTRQLAGSILALKMAASIMWPSFQKLGSNKNKDIHGRPLSNKW